ncbi:guanine nucleotide-binding protein G(o) subunit alpha-like [Thalassophryne amazonica]|uniref:guanine nucleotide-binding protein G(o) subunit alpha-like n=1 Tax=Thalassophryne amazonica TaxID=390379 RepID=UPI0014719FB5|nr:guanine nucleotide-binding protein G(o) subunit alpha-like [Thalassophryne amazonica]
MGLCFASEVPEEERKARIHSSRIDRDLHEAAKRDLNVVKILLLGAAESGKSTLVKQMKIIHGNGVTQQELRRFKPAVLDNLLTSMKFVLHGMGVLHSDLTDGNNKNSSLYHNFSPSPLELLPRFKNFSLLLIRIPLYHIFSAIQYFSPLPLYNSSLYSTTSPPSPL